MSRHIEHDGDYRAAPGHAWYQVDRMGGCAVVRVGGEIDARTVHEFHQVVTEAASLATHIVVDLEHVSFIDSSGLGGLIAARNTAKERDGSFSLVNPPPMVRRLLGSTRLHDVIAIYNSLPEAVNAATGR
jgi:anti-sigma B factor antagonist